MENHHPPITRVFRWATLALVAGGMFLVAAVAAPPPAQAQNKAFAIRTDLGLDSLEGEIFLGKFGLWAHLKTGEEESTCTGTFNRTYLGARFFFQRLPSSWYLGVYSFSANLAAGDTCGSGVDLDGVSLFGGYHWIVWRNLSIDLGLRPNILEFGLAF